MQYDLIIRNGNIYSGSGSQPIVFDVAVKQGIIEAVGDLGVADAAETFDATGLCVMPGFIDLHTHSDTAFKKNEAAQSAANLLRQGCTTVVSGNCGGGTYDVAEYLAKLASAGVGVNVLHLAGHGSIRRSVMENADRAPTDAELGKMKDILRQALDQGAVGMSTGLNYLPGAYACTEEVVEMARVLAEQDALYASHIRSESEGLLDSIDEIIRIGRESGARVHVAHIKCLGEAAWGKAAEVCARIEAAQAQGVRITADQYPYCASSTSLNATVTPLWARHEVKEALTDPEKSQRLIPQIAQNMEQRGGAENLLVKSVEGHPEWEGKRVNQIAAMLGIDPLEACLTLLRDHGPSIIAFSMREEDVRQFMPRPWVATGSDGAAQAEDETGVVHPRSYGAFARKLSHYARDEKVLPLGQAVRSASGLPADILGLLDRGYVRPGCVADLAVLDMAKYADQATFDDTRRCAVGVRRTYVNGQAAVVDDAYTGVRAGQALKRGEEAAP